ncbi:RNA polymerase sigma factor [Microbacterium aurum]
MGTSDQPRADVADIADADLVLRTRSGDHDAFAELWRRHYRSGVTVAASITSTFDADDLVQEATTAPPAASVPLRPATPQPTVPAAPPVPDATPAPEPTPTPTPTPDPTPTPTPTPTPDPTPTPTPDPAPTPDPTPTPEPTPTAAPALVGAPDIDMSLDAVATTVTVAGEPGRSLVVTFSPLSPLIGTSREASPARSSARTGR